jgi:hypothetical protein
MPALVSTDFVRGAPASMASGAVRAGLMIARAV